MAKNTSHSKLPCRDESQIYSWFGVRDEATFYKMKESLFPLLGSTYGPITRLDTEGSTPEKSSHVEKLSVLLKIAQVANVSHSTMSLELVREVLLDLACTLLGAKLSLDQNPEIFEHPAGISDAIGNVTMIHKPSRRVDHDEMEGLGVALSDLLQDFSRKERRDIRLDKKNESPSDLDGDIDDFRSETLLDAKRVIRNLRKDNNVLDRRNRTLWYRLDRETDRVNQLEAELLKLDPRRNKHLYRKDDLTPLDDRDCKYDDWILVNGGSSVQPAPMLSRHGEKVCILEHPRKMSESGPLKPSQLDSLSFE